MRENLTRFFSNNSEILVVVGIVSVVGLLVFPLPPTFLDLFLALSIASSLLVLLVALYIEKPLQFSSFPALLLLLTLYRLSLNVNSTRLILGRGDAGKVIEKSSHIRGAERSQHLKHVECPISTDGAGIAMKDLPSVLDE